VLGRSGGRRVLKLGRDLSSRVQGASVASPLSRPRSRSRDLPKSVFRHSSRCGSRGSPAAGSLATTSADREDFDPAPDAAAFGVLIRRHVKLAQRPVGSCSSRLPRRSGECGHRRKTCPRTSRPLPDPLSCLPCPPLTTDWFLRPSTVSATRARVKQGAELRARRRTEPSGDGHPAIVEPIAIVTEPLGDPAIRAVDLRLE
jgi:hypothetical protein